MFPSKNMVDYMTEMNRLFPRNESGSEDPLAPFSYNFYQSPFQPTMVNRSTSSTDSTSPESYPDLSLRSAIYPNLQESPRARAIVGRKILGKSQTTLTSHAGRMETEFKIWQYEEPLSNTPPEMPQQKNHYYELFSKENKGFEFKTPVKSETNMFDLSSNFPDRSPLSSQSPVNRNFSDLSPLSYQTNQSRTFSNQSPANLQSTTWSNSSLCSRIPFQRHLGSTSNFSSPRQVSKHQNIASSSTDEIAPTKMCTFCRKNGETPVVYMDHCVKQQVGNKHIVTCPILRSHVCAICGASGDNAHTITYCPVLRSNNNGRPLQSTTITLKNTRIKSNGKRRY